MSTRDDERKPYKGDVIGETKLAYKFEADALDEFIWLPKSQCTWEDKDSMMWVPRWMAREKGLVTK